ncbi:MAG: CoA-binding protein [Methanomicrobiales archaeon HGW-Methanomicrobiales-1]|jgi:acetyl coenzyme A synthetase (ADP forming)-like protein|nr:MAG: CoA-binding protein [Methanomicrobiales archaeon HGW-Methanomicrobiales-1]
MSRQLISEAKGYEILQKIGVPIPRYALATTISEAVSAAEKTGFPLVLKVVSPQIVHKSDAGGVITGIRNTEVLLGAYDKILSNVRAYNQSVVIEGIMVEQQLEKGLEIIIGGRIDPAFGKVITIGMGGTLVELIKDVSIRVLPVTTTDINAMLYELNGYRLIRGYRNEPPRDREALVQLIDTISRFFMDSTDIVEFDINPVILYEQGVCAVDARFYTDDTTAMAEPEPVRPLPKELLDIKSIALIGASSDPNKVGYAVLRNLLSFPGTLYPVNPKHPVILGRTTYPSITSIPGPVDVAVIVVPARVVPSLVEEAGKKGIPLVVIISSGFRESGAAGIELEDQVTAIARQYGIRIMGPNCLGIMFPHQGINTTFDPVSPKPGNLAFLSQSGAIITTIVDWSLPEEIGFSEIISVGNQADLTFEDYIYFAAEDPNTKAIIMYVEQIRNGRRFMEIVRQVTPEMPVVAIKAGSSKIGQMTAASHTGSLAGSYEVYQAAFLQSGIIPVRSIREAFQTAELLSSEGYPKGIRAIVISNAGGFAVLSSDYAELMGIELVELPLTVIKELDSILPVDWNRRNPIDMVGDASADRFARTFDVMIRNQELWDIAFIIAVPSAISDPIRVANELVRFSKGTQKMIVGCMIGGDSMKTPLRILRDSGIPNFPDLEDAFKAVGNICRHICWEEFHGRRCSRDDHKS